MSALLQALALGPRGPSVTDRYEQGIDRGMRLDEILRGNEARQFIGPAVQGNKGALAQLLGLAPELGLQVNRNLEAAADRRADMDWRREEAGRSQRNSDRSFSLQERGFNADEAWRRTQADLERQKLNQPDLTTDMKEYNLAKSQGYTGSFFDFQKEMKAAGASRTNIDTGTVPQGYQAVRDDQGRVVRYDPVPGGPADTSASNAVKAENQSTATDVIMNAASNIRRLAKSPGSTGLAGAGLSYNPATDAAEIYRQVEVLRSNAKVENLQAMRAASPTGGALGSVTEKENEMLAAKAGAIDPKSPYFMQQVDDYERTLLRIIHGKKVGDAIFEQSRDDGANDPLGIR